MWQRGVLARMVIKNDKVRLGLWKLRFQDGLSPKECVDRLTDAKVSCKTQIYETLREFDGAVSWQYTTRRRKRSERVCAGGLTAGELKCLKVLINEDPNRQYWQLQEITVRKLTSVYPPPRSASPSAPASRSMAWVIRTSSSSLSQGRRITKVVLHFSSTSACFFLRGMKTGTRLCFLTKCIAPTEKRFPVSATNWSNGNKETTSPVTDS